MVEVVNGYRKVRRGNGVAAVQKSSLVDHYPFGEESTNRLGCGFMAVPGILSVRGKEEL